MSDHTPGPWSLSAFDTTTVIAIRNGPDRDGHEYVDGRHQITIARPAPAKDIPDINERAANARLIAVAPETAAERDRLQARVAELEAALEPCLLLIDHMSEFVGEMALPDYKLFNEAPIKAAAVLKPGTERTIHRGYCGPAGKPEE